jgi:hypothetical protein
MHQYVKYNLQDPSSQREACIDVLDWFGWQKYRLIAKALIKGDFSSLDQFRLIVSIGGVQGFPVKAMWERYTKF